MRKQAEPANVSDIDRTLRELIVPDHLRRIAADRIKGF
jgi:hypothetical protein